MAKLNGCISLIEDDNILKKYTIWDKVNPHIKKEIDNEPVCNKTFLKTKIKSYGDDATDFHDKEIPKAGSDCTCLAVFTIDSALKKKKTTAICKCFLKNANTLKKN